MIYFKAARFQKQLFIAFAVLSFSANSYSQVISQVYGGGQGAAAVYKSDYVELFNPTASDIALTGYSLQYQPSGSTGAWSGKVALTGTIPAHKYFLVQMSATSGSGASALDLPTPDVTSTAVSMSATAAKVALVNNATTLVTPAGPPVVCPGASAGVLDLVGYGSAANCAETAPTVTLSTATAAFRAGGGCTDTDNNSSDFSAVAPNPRNSSSASMACTIGLSGTGSATPSSVLPGSSTTLIANISPASNPPSTGITVTCQPIGVGATINLPNTTGSTYAAPYMVPLGTAAQTYSISCNVSDGQSRSSMFSISLTVTGSSTPPTAVGLATPSTVSAGNATNLTATPTSGANPPSSTYAETCNLSQFGGATSVSLPTTYVIPVDATPVVNASIPCTVTDDLNRSTSFNIGLTVVAPPPTTHLIFEINGAGLTSPLAGQSVSTRGIVTAVRGTTGSTKGFYIESVSADRDANPSTSEGLLIFIGSSSLPACAVVGNNITIQGTVQDFVPSTSPVGSIPLTELSSTSNCQVVASNQSGLLPPAVTIDSAVIAAGGSAFQARKLLGMRVALGSSYVVGPSLGTLNENTAQATTDPQFFVSLQGVPRAFRSAGILATNRPADAAVTVPSWNGNPEVFRIDTLGLAGGLTGGAVFEVAVGTTVSSIVGIMDYDTADGQYQIYTNQAGVGLLNPTTPTLTATPIPLPLTSDLLVVNANMERFFNDLNDGNGNSVLLTSSAYQGRLNKVSLAFRNVLHLPDVVVMEEVEGPGPTDPQNYPVPADIVNKINADAAANSQGSPNYGFCQYPTNDIGQISVSIIYRRDRVSLVDCTEYGLATQYNTPAGGSSLLNDRPPTVLRANVTAAGSDSPMQIRIVGNHLRSLSGIDQPGSANGDRVRAKRNEQAKYLANLLTGNLSEQTTNWNLTDNLLVSGDMNAFDVNDGYVDVVNCFAGFPAAADQQYFSPVEIQVSSPCTAVPTLALNNLTTVDPAQRYSYSFSGTAQRIDHLLVNNKLNARVRQFAYGRNNADFPEGSTYRNDFNRSERYSDHDMPAVYIKLPVEVTSRTGLNASAAVLNRASGRYNGTFTITNTGTAALTGPVYVFFNNLPAGVTLPDLPQSNGVPYATVNLPAGLASGATSGSVSISFANPTNARISYTATRFDVNF